MRRAVPSFLLLLSLGACRDLFRGPATIDARPHFSISIVRPENPNVDPDAGVDHYRVTILVAGGEDPPPFDSLSAADLEGKGDTEITIAADSPVFGQSVQILLEGIDSGGATLSRGVTAPFALARDSASARLYFSHAGGFELVQAVDEVRAGAAVFVCPSGHAILLGGRDGDGNPHASVLRFDPETNAAEILSDVAMTTASAFSRLNDLGEGRFLVTGGIASSTGTPTDATVLAACTETSVTLESRSPIPIALRDHRAEIVTDGLILVAGGYSTQAGDEASLVDRAYVYDLQADSWSASIDVGQRRAGAVLCAVGDGNAVVGAGLTGTPTPYERDLRFYAGDLENTTDLTTNLLEARAWPVVSPFGVGGIGPRFLVAGGAESGDRFRESVEILEWDADSETISTAASTAMPVAFRMGSALSMAGGRTLVVGGDVGTGANMTPMTPAVAVMFSSVGGVTTLPDPGVTGSQPGVALLLDGTALIAFDDAIVRFNPAD